MQLRSPNTNSSIQTSNRTQATSNDNTYYGSNSEVHVGEQATRERAIVSTRDGKNEPARLEVDISYLGSLCFRTLTSTQPRPYINCRKDRGLVQISFNCRLRTRLPVVQNRSRFIWAQCDMQTAITCLAYHSLINLVEIHYIIQLSWVIASWIKNIQVLSTVTVSSNLELGRTSESLQEYIQACQYVFLKRYKKSENGRIGISKC